jgi:hypothetical protein
MVRVDRQRNALRIPRAQALVDRLVGFESKRHQSGHIENIEIKSQNQCGRWQTLKNPVLYTSSIPPHQT